MHFQRTLNWVITMKIDQLEQLARDTLIKCLKDIPFLQVKQTKKGAARKTHMPAILLTLKLPSGEQLLVAEVKKNGQPRLAREAVNQILRYLEAYPSAYGVFIAPYISSQAADICSQEGIGYGDLAGNCRLVFQQGY